MSLLLKLLAAIGPLLLTVFFAWLVMDGYLDFGGGGKDVLLVLPLLLWSLVYLGCYLMLWWCRRRPECGVPSPQIRLHADRIAASLPRRTFMPTSVASPATK